MWSTWIKSKWLGFDWTKIEYVMDRLKDIRNDKFFTLGMVFDLIDFHFRFLAPKSIRSTWRANQAAIWYVQKENWWLNEKNIKFKEKTWNKKGTDDIEQ